MWTCAEGSNCPITIDRMDSTTKRGFLLAKGWIQAVLLVTLFGFFVLGFFAYKTYAGRAADSGKGRQCPTVKFSSAARPTLWPVQGIFLQELGLMEYRSYFSVTVLTLVLTLPQITCIAPRSWQSTFTTVWVQTRQEPLR